MTNGTSTKMNVEDLEPFIMILDDSLLVTSVTYTPSRIMIDGIRALGRSKEQILKDEGWWIGED